MNLGSAVPCRTALPVLVLSLVAVLPGPTRADWQIYYTGEAQRLFGAHGRGSFPTRTAAEEYRCSRPGFERKNSYSAGFDSAADATPRSEPSPPDEPAREREGPRGDEAAFDRKKAELLDALRGHAREGLRLKGSGRAALRPKASSRAVVSDGSGDDRAVSRETHEIERDAPAWIEGEKERIRRRLAQPNPWNRALAASLTTKAPPLPYKRFGELQPGDVLLVEGSKLISGADGMLSGVSSSRASHTLIFLKESMGTKLFLDDQPGEGPRIVPEAYVRTRYGQRRTEVARLAQPLSPEEAARLYAAAKTMRARNVRKMDALRRLHVAANGLAGDALDTTDYGLWGKENMVCSEASWALINAAGRKVPRTTGRAKQLLGIDFSPADFYAEEQHFLVTPLAW